MTKPIQTLGLVVIVLITFSAAGIGTLAGPMGGGDWYAQLSKPPLTPPGWLFGPVWTLLYLMMAVAAWLVWLRWPVPGVGWALGAYGVQLALNAAWSLIFFGAHEIGWAMAELAVLWLAILVTLLLMWRVQPLAGLLMIPYLAWVTFAGYLNWSLWRLNA